MTFYLCALSSHFRSKIRRNFRGTRFLVACFLTLLMIFSSSVLFPNEYAAEGEHSFHSRSLLAINGSNASDVAIVKRGEYPPEIFTPLQLKQGAVVLYVLGMIYMFLALAIVCDEFFVPALEVIIDTFGIPEDVAGATFMAAGGSAPELFTSVIGVFIAYSNVGIGTIVGSAVFNILFVIGMCAVFSHGVLQLTWWPLFRDVTFYSISLIFLIWFFLDEKIYWWESLILLLCYVAYVVFMKFNVSIERMVKSKLTCCKGNDELERPSEERNSRTWYGSLAAVRATHRFRRYATLKVMVPPRWSEAKMFGSPHHTVKFLKGGEGGSRLASCTDDTSHSNRDKLPNIVIRDPARDAEREKMTQSEDSKNQDDLPDDEPLDLSWPDSCFKRLTYLFVAPIIFPLWLTLPDVRLPKKRKFFWWGFIGSILWIAVFSYLMTWWASVVGDTIGIPDAVMGLTFLAAGTSVPDLMTSVIVAKKGFGDMAVSSSVGSNIFDVTVGLPLPWLMYSLIHGRYFSVSSEGLFCSIVLLFGVLMLVIITIASFRWKMNKGMGIAMFVLYCIFLLISLLLEYKKIPCPV